MRKTSVAIVLASALVLLTSCHSKEVEVQPHITNQDSHSLQQSETAVSTETDNSMRGFLHSNSQQREQIFVNWTDQKDQLNGSMQFSRSVQSGNRNSIKTDSFPFTGVMSQGSVSLNFSGGFFNALDGKTINGTIDNDELILYFPNNDGILSKLIFKESSVQEFNFAVQSLTDEVKESNDQQAEIEAHQRQETTDKKKIEKEQNAVSQANRSLQNSIESAKEKLNQRENFASQFTTVIESYETHWKQMNSNKQKLLSAAKVKPFNSDQYYVVQDILYIIGDNEYSISDDTYQFQDIEWRISSYISDLKDAKAEVDSNWSLLERVSLQNSTGVPQPQYSEKEVSEIANKLQGEINSVNSLLASNQKLSNQYQEKAEKLSDEMSDYVNDIEVDYE
ncbi:hypothetical protein CXK86_11340 [Paenibacillus sp. BGI2013]|uniref:hypothetical protein n=1 Tax=Paenibacillus sp. BGI2013 TaxID=2058902 RepID=UPI000C6E42F2|nr:hypothetical protein [Paenibacillus sp. BGI2013]PKQ90633.1 hypothetical protein CXK86_11340 [Paenibacillus sp. BGI2013]